MSFGIVIDALMLATPRILVGNITYWRGRDNVEPMNLAPGAYEILDGRGVAAFEFTITDAGAVDYSSGADGCATGRGTNTLTLRGFGIVVDARLLTTPRYSVSNITDWRRRDQVDSLALMPGTYDLLDGRGVTAMQFTLKNDGTVDYAPEADAFVSGRGTNTLTLLGCNVTVDAHPLASPQYLIYNITDWRRREEVGALALVPGGYEIFDGRGIPVLQFTVQSDGTVDYSAEADAFVSGRGTSMLALQGFSIAIDAHELSTPEFLVLNITDWRSRDLLDPLVLVPGAYEIVDRRGISAFQFFVTPAGQVDYPAEADGYVSGRGTSTLSLHGLPVTLDARAISLDRFLVESITAWTGRNETPVLRLLCGTYSVRMTADIVAEAGFEVLADGTVKFRPDGVHGVRSPAKVQYTGLRIWIDVSALQGIASFALRLVDQNVSFNTGRPQPMAMAHFPWVPLTLELRRPGLDAQLIEFFLKPGPMIDLDEAYPFVQLGSTVKGEPVMKISGEVFRVKVPCKLRQAAGSPDTTVAAQVLR